MSTGHKKNAEVIFLNSVFPVLSETFLFEQYSLLLKNNMSMAIVSNNQVDIEQIHPNMRDIQKDVDYLCHISKKQIIVAHAHLFLKHPLSYLKSFFSALSMEEKLKTSLAHITGAAVVFLRYKKMRWVHAHFTYGAAGIAFWLSKIANIPYSITLHGADLTYDDPPDLSIKMSNAAHIFSISKFNIDYVKAHFFAVKDEKTSIIPLGVSLTNSETQPGPTNEQLTLLNVGRLSEHKAQHLLINACASLKRAKLNFKCYIIGEGPKRKELEALIDEQKLAQEVILLGAVYHQEVLQWYRQADIFVLSSITEGMPLVIMEAMQKGLIVVAPELSGIPELLDQGRAGILFDPGDVESLTNQLNKVIDGRFDLEQIRQNATDYVESHFDVEKNTLKFQKKLQQLSHQNINEGI